MKKILFTSAVYFYAGILSAQIYMAKTCQVDFFSEAPVENIEAVNKSAQPILNTATGDIQVRIPIISFKFQKPLMEEHFNENYMETEKYPNATFKGKINEPVDWSKPGEYKVTATGKLNIHGVEKERTIPGTITIRDGQILLNSVFNVHVADHGIKVPSLYVKNIAEDVKVTLNAVMEQYRKQAK